MLLDLTVTRRPDGLRFDAPGLHFRDLIPLWRSFFPEGLLRIIEAQGFRGTWPPPEHKILDGNVLEVEADSFLDDVEASLLEESGPLFQKLSLVAVPYGSFEDLPASLPVPGPGGMPGPALPAIPPGGLAFASEEDFLAAIGVPEDDAQELFVQLLRAVFVDHPGVARGLKPDDARRLFFLTAESGGIHFNPEKWRADPLGRVSLANLGTRFHFPCHAAPTEGSVTVVRLTLAGDRLDVSEPFATDVNHYLDVWYDRPVGCRKFVQAGLWGALILLILFLILLFRP